MSTLGSVQYTGLYHDKCGGRSLGKQLNLYVLNIPRCTHDTPSVLNTPGVLNDIPQCTEPPLVYCTDIMQGESVVC